MPGAWPKVCSYQAGQRFCKIAVPWSASPSASSAAAFTLSLMFPAFSKSPPSLQLGFFMDFSKPFLPDDFSKPVWMDDFSKPLLLGDFSKSFFLHYFHNFFGAIVPLDTEKCDFSKPKSTLVFKLLCSKKSCRCKTCFWLCLKNMSCFEN